MPDELTIGLRKRDDLELRYGENPHQMGALYLEAGRKEKGVSGFEQLHGIPMSWRTEITVWDPPHEFVDTQLRGPYSQWIHRHTFTELSPNRTLIEDEVRYRLPLEPLGDLAHFIVRGQLERIFDFRETAVAKILAKAP